MGINQITHTEEILHQRPIHSDLLDVPERDHGGHDLAQAELLRRQGEDVRRVVRLGAQLARDLAVGEHLGRHERRRPPLLRLVEHRRVEDVVVAEVGIRAAGQLLVA